MVFANLFTSLSAVEDTVADIQLPSTRRNASDQGRRGEPGKRKPHCDQGGPFPKKRCSQDGKPRTNQPAGYNFTTQCHNIPKTDRPRESVPFSKHAGQNRKDNVGGSRICQNYNSKNKSNGKRRKGQADKKFDRHSHQGAGRNTHRPAFMNNSGSRKRHNQAFQERPRSMTQEFKEQNALEVDGQLLCRHFLMGKCIKGDDCQLKHVPGYNDLIKLSCKFYIQGFCLKGDSCPYMHKSFPCRFFHRGARCLQEANCRFSHDPLTDLTSKLLDEAIKRDREVHEQARAAEQRLAGSSMDTEQSDISDKNKLPDFFLQPLRPNFYKNSADVDDKTVEESLTCQTGDLKCEPTLDSNKSQQVDSTEAHSPPVAKPGSPKPVCYSVEAVLGSQRFKPATHAFTFPPLSSSATSNPSDQKGAPYSVDTVLNSFKSVEGWNYGLKKAPYTQTVSYTPSKAGEETCLLKSSQATCLAEENDKMQEKSVTSLTLSKDPNSNSLTKPSQAFREQKHQHKDGWTSSNSAQSSTCKVDLDDASNGIKSSASLTSEGVRVVKQAEKSSTLSRERASSKISIPKVEAQSSLKSFSSKMTLIKNSDKMSAPGAGCNAPITKNSDSATDDENAPTRLFQSLFKTPLAANPLPVVDSISSPSPNDLAALSCPPSNSTRGQSERCKRQDKGVAAGSSARFSAAPADATSVSPSDNNRAWSLEVHRGANPEESNSLQAKAEEKSPNLKARRRTLCANQPSEHQVEPPETDSLSDGTHEQPADVSSHKEVATVRSVLKTLFLCLSPFQQDECEDQSNSQVPAESRENGAQRSHMETDAVGKQSTEEMSDGHREQKTSHRLTGISEEPSISSPAGPHSRQTHPGRHSSPVRSVKRMTPQAPHHTGPAEKRIAERAACANTAVPFRNLFKTFAAAQHTAQ